jgi:hypothetical protein
VRLPIITLTTDFGHRDAYVAAMKGAILGICPQATLVDVSHCVPAQDVAAGAFLLHSAHRFFPPGTVHVAVVDPGVGSDRRGIVVETAHGVFVGPDNGLFGPVYELGPVERIVEIRNPDLMLPRISSTFHGRDIFGPVAAHLSMGTPVDEVGPEVDEPAGLSLWELVEGDGELRGRIVHIDHFGNGITNLQRGRIEAAAGGGTARVCVGDRVFSGVSRAYAEAADGEPLVLYGSQDAIEVSVNGGSAEASLGLKRGDEVTVKWEEKTE